MAATQEIEVDAAALSNCRLALVLAPHGRDAAIAATLLREAGIVAEPCDDLPGLCVQLGNEVGLAILAEEALRGADLRTIAHWVKDQPSWSDFPFIVLTRRGGGLERNPEAHRMVGAMGNVTFLERPFHPTSLASVARTALRARQRQFEARARLDDLAEKEARLRTALKAGRLGSWELDLAIWTLSASEVSKAHFGRSGDEPFTYADLIRGLHPDDQHAVQTALEHCLHGGRDLRVEYRFVLPEGSTRWIEMRARLLRDHLGRPARMVGVSSDITDRKRAEAERERLLGELEAERARFKTAIENMPVGVALVEQGGWIVLANPAFRDSFAGPRLPSYDANAARGWVACHGDREPVLPEDFPGAKALRGEAVLGAEFSHLATSGRHTWSRISGIPVRDASGKVTGALVIIIDVSKEKEAQEALKRLAETLEQRVEERTAQLAAANEDLRKQVVERERAEEQLRQAQKMEAIGQLTGGVAHDFNNLLMAVITNLDLLHKRAGQAPETARLIKGALEGAHRGAALTQRLLAFARRQDLQPKPVDLSELLRGMLPLFERSVGPLVTVEFDVPQVLRPANADPNQVELALLNLAVNARDAMPDGGVLRIGLEQRDVARDGELSDGTYLILRVEDNGIGMDGATLSKAIDPFFTTKEVGKGTGLGLSMVHGLAVQLGGALRLSSHPGEGTIAELWLPAANVLVAAPSQRIAATGEQDVNATVLLVEDDALIAMSTADMLEDLGLSVIEARCGEEAVRILERNAKIDLLLTDHAMPGMTGVELAREAGKLRPGLPVLLVTGYAELPNDAGAEIARLSKPYDRHQLVAAIRSLLARPAPAVD